MPRQNRRNGIADHALCFTQLGFEDEIVGKGLEAGRFAHGNTSGQFVVELVVAMTFCANGMGGFVGVQFAAALIAAFLGQ